MTASKESENKKVSPIKRWHQAFEKEPLQALDSLICERFYMGVLNRNETDEILYQLFSNRGKKVLGQLDKVMQQWFETNWGQMPGSIATVHWAKILKNG